jgi:hypothetical protein
MAASFVLIHSPSVGPRTWQPGRVRGCVFVDAALPPASGAVPVAPPELLALLRAKASDGLLPRWTDWWDAQPCAYLLFGPPYDELASEARRRGWIVEHLPGAHLHQLVDPEGVARRLLAIAQQPGSDPTEPQG